MLDRLMLTALLVVPGGPFLHPGSRDGLPLYVDTFEIERTPVTWGQFAAFAAGTPRWEPLAGHAGEFPPDAPVVFVTHDDARAYCEAAGRRLPDEAEWEYAANGGQRTVSQDFTPAERAELAWYGGARKRPKPVGQGMPDAFGLQDMHGNVWEWVADLGTRYAAKDPRDPVGTDNLGCGRVVGDGGSYAFYLRAAVRAAATPDQRTRYRGFRCAR